MQRPLTPPDPRDRRIEDISISHPARRKMHDRITREARRLARIPLCVLLRGCQEHHGVIGGGGEICPDAARGLQESRAGIVPHLRILPPQGHLRSEPVHEDAGCLPAIRTAPASWMLAVKRSEERHGRETQEHEHPAPQLRGQPAMAERRSHPAATHAHAFSFLFHGWISLTRATLARMMHRPAKVPAPTGSSRKTTPKKRPNAGIRNVTVSVFVGPALRMR